MGLPLEMPYLSDGYMELVEAAVFEAEKLGMKVILYDEGMYPSGSACGMVVKRNADFASRGLRLQEHPVVDGSNSVRINISLEPGESIVSVQAVRKLTEREIEPGSSMLLDWAGGVVEFTPPNKGEWSVLVFVDSKSQGTIRGVHPGQDDGEPDAPLAADLLNPEATRAFIELTHERYYAKLSRFFGGTVIAMFTDEPDLLGRGHAKGLKPWTRGFLGEYIASGGQERDLPAIWLDVGMETADIRLRYEAAIRKRLNRTYYKMLADWCEAHGIGLTGHPASSEDIGLLGTFHIPGQDVVWRYIAPEEDKAVTGVHSTMGKCSSDSARHRGKRRNLNECFGVCDVEGGWSLSADNMKWYLDWLFVRGVNLISPHAFYYSIRDERRDERPPDVGPNNIWWPEYAKFSRYIKRMSWLMTDSMNSAKVAVLAGEAFLPWRIVKPLYESQIEYNYLEAELLEDGCEIADGAIQIAGYRYGAILIEDGRRLTPAVKQRLEQLAAQGGLVIELVSEGESALEIGQLKAEHEDRVPDYLANKTGRDYSLEPASTSIRVSRIEKNGALFYVIVNEGEEAYQGKLRMNHVGQTELWSPWTGEIAAAKGEQSSGSLSIELHVERRECIVVAVDPSRQHENEVGRPTVEFKTLNLSKGWRVVEGPVPGELHELSSWTDWGGLANFSGTVVYENTFELQEPSGLSSFKLDLGEVHEVVRFWVNGKEAGVQFWKPYVFDIGRYLQQGTNVLRASIANSMANQYDGKSFPSGLLGPVRLHEYRPAE